MLEEARRRAVGHGPARRLAPAAQPDPAGLEQRVERALGGDDAADLLDLGPRHRLVVGDDGERLHRGARQLARLDDVAREEEGQVAGGAERPFAGDLDEVDAAIGVMLGKVGEDRGDVASLRQPAGKLLRGERLARRKQQRLGDAQGFPVVGRGRDIDRDLAGNSAH